jgi:3-oxoacyl-[acyl-carrier-protein] synthase II
MKAPLNRRVYVIGTSAITPLGATRDATFARAANNEGGLSFFEHPQVPGPYAAGVLRDWNPSSYSFATQKELQQWNAAFVTLTMAACHDALLDAGVVVDGQVGPRMACIVGSAINGSDAFRVASVNLHAHGAGRVSPFLLPNVCANVPAGKAGVVLGFTGPIFSPQSACASGNHAIALGARMVRDGDCDFAIVGGVEMPLIPEIIHGFANMTATFRTRPSDRAFSHPEQASRPFSADRKGFVLAEGAGMLVLAAEEVMRAHGLTPHAEIAGVGWTSDAHHFTRPYQPTIVRALRQAFDDAELDPGAVDCINAHGTSTPAGDSVEVECLTEVFGGRLAKVPISSNKSQVGHSLGAAAAIEAVLAIEGMRRHVVLPTLNFVPDPKLPALDFVTVARSLAHEHVLSNAFGFGGTNCTIIFQGA